MTWTRRRLLTTTLALPVLVAAGSVVGAPPASAYTWSRTLSEGASGADVVELQIRVAGWAADTPTQTRVAVDGAFGPGTRAAVQRFQRGYGLTADGIAGPATHAALNALEAADGSTAHFGWNEFWSKDGAQFSGGNVAAAQVQENVRRLMYKLEAVRRKAGGRAVTINSGFRSLSHNAAVGGAGNSQHTYGIAADIVVSGLSVTAVMNHAKTSGFGGILRYSTFTHVDSRMDYSYGAQSWVWHS